MSEPGAVYKSLNPLGLTRVWARCFFCVVQSLLLCPSPYHCFMPVTSGGSGASARWLVMCTIRVKSCSLDATLLCHGSDRISDCNASSTDTRHLIAQSHCPAGAFGITLDPTNSVGCTTRLGLCFAFTQPAVRLIHLSIAEGVLSSQLTAPVIKELMRLVVLFMEGKTLLLLLWSVKGNIYLSHPETWWTYH